MKSAGIAGFTKGAVSGVAGLASVVFIAPLGFIAKTTEGIGASTKTLEIGVIDTRCRPARSVPWGSPMLKSGMSFMKAIGIRVHCVRYQKVRKQASGRINEDEQLGSWRSSKELKRIRSECDSKCHCVNLLNRSAN